MIMSCSIVFLALLPALPAGESVADEVRRRTRDVLTDTVALYKWFHAHPELSNQEKETAARLAAEIEAIGLEVHTGIGGFGLVGVLRGSGSGGPVVLSRADMDGLPVFEKTGVPYASTREGVMHACGHDVHMATAVGTLKVLKAMSWKGTVFFVGQPAEELGQGARAMLGDARFKRILDRLGRPKVALALHDASDLPAGKVSLCPGFAHANVDSVDIIIHGKGGHGAHPERAIDPIVIGAETVLSLQTIISRRIKANDRAVITVGKFSAGTKHNIIPPRANLLLTVRSYSDETRKLLLDEIRRVAVNVARAHRAPRDPEVTILDEYTPAAYNDPDWTRRLEALYRQGLGTKRVERHEPTLGGEDFGRYSRQLGCPGVMVKLGAVNPKRFTDSGGENLPGLHSDVWAPDPEPTLETGINAMALAILDALTGK